VRPEIGRLCHSYRGSVGFVCADTLNGRRDAASVSPASASALKRGRDLRRPTSVFLWGQQPVSSAGSRSSRVSGRSKVNVEPLPSSLSTKITPWGASTALFTILVPRPVPPGFVLTASSRNTLYSRSTRDTRTTCVSWSRSGRWTVWRTCRRTPGTSATSAGARLPRPRVSVSLWRSERGIAAVRLVVLFPVGQAFGVRAGLVGGGDSADDECLITRVMHGLDPAVQCPDAVVE